ncbi:hypothetical protein CRUP_012598 [Coryphaenoides rupestris]|nr:hypothetical protein CRUP_012598 [Coryphaenoides rupestris]
MICWVRCSPGGTTFHSTLQKPERYQRTSRRSFAGRLRGGDAPPSVLMTQNIMEQASQPFDHNNRSAGNEPPARSDVDNKRLKELRNAALHTTLTSRMETEAPADPEARPRTENGEEGEEPSSFNHRRRSDEAPGPAATETRGEGTQEEEDEGSDSNVTNEKVAEEERTLTDHLNKRLLFSFLEKLNQRDLALPGVRHLDCARETLRVQALGLSLRKEQTLT